MPSNANTFKRRKLRGLVSGVLALVLAVLLAFLINFINGELSDQPETAVQVIGALFAILLILPPTIYLLLRRRSADPVRLGLTVLAGISIMLVSIYLYSASFDVLFPADILIWSESEFVNDIVKFRVGYPIYSPEENNESFFYPPGAQILTYVLAWLIGKPTSIPVYRMIQVGYTFLAALVAFCCCLRLLNMSVGTRPFRDEVLWGMVCLPILFLIATNSLTNWSVHLLHNDALAQLLSIVAFWMLLTYVSTPNKPLLALMALVPAAGFLVKQSLIIWAPLYCAHLAFFEQPRSVKRLLTFTLAALGGAVVKTSISRISPNASVFGGTGGWTVWITLRLYRFPGTSNRL